VSERSWLFLIPQVPATPSSLRVMVWRRLREAGAAGLGGGVWVLPQGDAQEAVVREIVREVAAGGGGSILLSGSPLEPTTEDDLIARFKADRDQEYAEFCSQCLDYAHQIRTELVAGNFTVAGLQENKTDLRRLEHSLHKIRSRDFYTGDKSGDADACIEECRGALETYAGRIAGKVR